MTCPSCKGDRPHTCLECGDNESWIDLAIATMALFGLALLITFG